MTGRDCPECGDLGPHRVVDEPSCPASDWALQELSRCSQRIERLAAEADFLATRATAEHRREHPRCYGRASNALALYVLGRAPRPQVPGTPTREGVQGVGHIWVGNECGTDYPHEEDDLAACQRTFAMAPPHLQERLRPVLDEFTGWVRQRRNWHGVVIPS